MAAAIGADHDDHSLGGRKVSVRNNKSNQYTRIGLYSMVLV